MLTTACSKTQIVPDVGDSKAAKISEKTKGLIQKLKAEDTKLSNKTLPTDISGIDKACHEIFYSLMSENDSTELEPDAILGTNSNMYIKISNNIKIDTKENRLIEFGKKNPAEGSSTKVYIQSFDGKSVSIKEVLAVYTNSNNIARVGPSDIYVFAGKYYAVVSDLMFDADKDRDYVRLTVNSVIDNSWKNSDISNYGDYKNLYVDKGNTYNLESTEKGLKILIKNKDGKILNQTFVDFTGKLP
jgi:hypothetical protein